jgi:Putative adhesin
MNKSKALLILAALAGIPFASMAREIYTLEPKGTVRIEAGSVDVVVSGGNDRDVSAELKGPSKMLEGSTLKMHREPSGVLVIEATRAPRRTWLNWRGRDNVELLVSVPADTEVRANVTSGDVTLAQIDGSVSVSAQAGDLSLTGIQGKIDLTTGSGDVECREINAERLRAHTGSGDIAIQLSRSTATLDLATTSGDIDIQVPRGSAWLKRVATATGDVIDDTSSVQSAGNDIEVRSHSGDVWIRELT